MHLSSKYILSLIVLIFWERARNLSASPSQRKKRQQQCIKVDASSGLYFMIQCDAVSNYWNFLSHLEQLNSVSLWGLSKVCCFKWLKFNDILWAAKWLVLVMTVQWNAVSNDSNVMSHFELLKMARDCEDCTMEFCFKWLEFDVALWSSCGWSNEILFQITGISCHTLSS